MIEESKVTVKDETTLLKGIQVGGKDLPNFNNEVTSYTYDAYGMEGEVPKVTAEAVSEDVKVEITQAGGDSGNGNSKSNR